MGDGPGGEFEPATHSELAEDAQTGGAPGPPTEGVQHLRPRSRLHHRLRVPWASTTECTPSPSVSSLILATPSSPRTVTMSVAPNSSASFWRDACQLIAMIRATPNSRARRAGRQRRRHHGDADHRIAGRAVGGQVGRAAEVLLGCPGCRQQIEHPDRVLVLALVRRRGQGEVRATDECTARTVVARAATSVGAFMPRPPRARRRSPGWR